MILKVSELIEQDEPVMSKAMSVLLRRYALQLLGGWSLFAVVALTKFEQGNSLFVPRVGKYAIAELHLNGY